MSEAWIAALVVLWFAAVITFTVWRNRDDFR